MTISLDVLCITLLSDVGSVIHNTTGERASLCASPDNGQEIGPKPMILTTLVVSRITLPGMGQRNA